MAASAPDTYSIADDEVITGEAVGLDVRPTGFVLRAAGCLIDWLLSVAIFVALIIGLSIIGGGLDEAAAAAFTIASLAFAIVIVPLTIEVATRGRSLGKLAIGARIVRDDGGAIRFRHSFIRALTGAAEIYLTFGGIAALAALLNPKAKRFGDMLAGTYSQHERVPHVQPAVFGMPLELSGWARVADVAPLPERLSRRIAQFLSQAGRMVPASRAALAAELAREASTFVSPLPAVDPELFLAGVAVLRREREATSLDRQRRVLENLEPHLANLPNGFPDR